MLAKAKSVFVVCLILTLSQSLSAAPKLTSLKLSAPVDPGYYLAVLSPDSSNTGVFINPGQIAGNSTTDPSAPLGPGGAGFTAAPALLQGISSGYGQILISIPATVTPLTAELSSLKTNMPTNTNTLIFDGVTGPLNKVNIELNRAIPAGTEVTFTIDMNSEPAHLIAVMGGTYPTVTYDSSGTGTLTIKSTTFGTTNNAGESFTSMIGFMIVTDPAFGTTALRIMAHTDHWVGDIFALLPGLDASASVTGAGGTWGTFNAKCGFTAYGQTGQTRTVNIFIPNATVSSLFGGAVTTDSLKAYVDANGDTTAVFDALASNVSVTGVRATFNFTFASAKDAALGGPGLSAGIIEESGSALPSAFALHANYPNPFNPITKIKLDLAKSSDWEISIFNLLGQQVDYYSGRSSAGTVTLEWDGANFASGVYFYKAVAGNFVATRKMIMLK
ncbi:MAG: T9SS type A sorting domain-containing protein [candidate division Zixibacteria bacterium]|nr:T9SS type A sorting domain-containing protein [candidate division Zixibacteria bacterium]